jgi:tetratricopeptide (TPR) repeat protein
MRFKIAALFEFEGKTPPTNATGLAAITPLVLKQFGFLPQPVLVTIEGDEVVIQYPEESTAAQAEAARLAERAGKRAAEGHYEKAIGILKRALELQPSLHKARRDLAMAYAGFSKVSSGQVRSSLITLERFWKANRSMSCLTSNWLKTHLKLNALQTFSGIQMINLSSRYQRQFRLTEVATVSPKICTPGEIRFCQEYGEIRALRARSGRFQGSGRCGSSER